jgi:transcriptional regulator with PAS, ATPase and Fis domain
MSSPLERDPASGQSSDSNEGSTAALSDSRPRRTTAGLDDDRPRLRVQGIVLEVSLGPDRGRRYASSDDRISIGSHELNHLVLSDASVSRFHCEILIEPTGPRLRDLGSRNGTFVDGLEVRDVYLRAGSQIQLGTTVIRLSLSSNVNDIPLYEQSEFGPLIGVSLAMRSVFALLARAAATESTVLIEGETGTGKEGAATAIHEASRRASQPFVVVDCGALPANLLESELFGHEKGAFTGAFERRHGAFAEASGGTVFLDEVGELPLEVQPALLRVLDSRKIRRVGGNYYEPVDVRVIAATNRDLRSAVNNGRFRADLYYRLAVLRIRLPPLRERLDDIDALVPKLLLGLGLDRASLARVSTPALLQELKQNPWPGNVRQLRNHLERYVAFDFTEPSVDSSRSPKACAPTPEPQSYEAARRAALERWEHAFTAGVLEASGGNVERAAKMAGISRAAMYRLVSRHGLLGRFRPGS